MTTNRCSPDINGILELSWTVWASKGQTHQEQIHKKKKTLIAVCIVMTSLHCFQIEGVDPDNARVMVKLAIGGKNVTISQYAVKLVFRKEYEKYSKDLSE